MLPIYTRALTTADYGILELLTMTMDVVAIVVGVGLSNGIYRFYYKFDTKSDRNSVVSTAIFLLTVSYFVASACIFTSAEQISNIILGTSIYRFHVQLMSYCFFFQIFIEIPLVFIKAIQKPVLFVSVNSLKLVLQLTLNIYFVFFLKMSIIGILYSTLITEVCAGCLLLFFTIKNTGFIFSFRIAKSMLLFGSPLIIANLADFIITYSDRYFLRIYHGVDSVGVYSLGYKLGFVLWAVSIEPILSIWLPQRFELAKDRRRLQEINMQIFLYANFILIFSALVISIFSFDLFRVMSNRDFWASSKIVPIILFAYIVQAWTDLGNFGIYYSGKTKYRAIGTAISAAVMIILCFLLVPLLGMYGAGIATISAFLVRFAYIYYHAQLEYKLDYAWNKCLTMLLIASIIYISSKIVHFEDIFLSILFNSFLAILFLLSCYILPIFSLDEKNYMKRAIIFPVSTLRNMINS